ncbi:hypothetical protein GRF29_185g1017525 [Pseudopithomyces chartarum]|uniref:Carboxylesterase type B domain-containing protein n=1 Tax=Pseudopithomyces chartarum TaxID=1892770 RepID=A0AAN6RCH3_9PLEO|nr:hypothetical protein GRF29_185g1017525 [Pseudopithomyces chartarum]
MKLLGPLALTCTLVTAVEKVVDLGYSKYAGRVVGDGTTQWLGMRYAAPPLGNLRFRAPANPLSTRGVQDATKFGDICIAQSPGDWTNTPNPRFTVGEDCLFVNVFAPSHASTKSKLPVMFYVQGGGFESVGVDEEEYRKVWGGSRTRGAEWGVGGGDVVGYIDGVAGGEGEGVVEGGAELLLVIALNSTSHFRALFSTAAPFLSTSALDTLVSLYATGPQPSFPNAGLYWRAASNAYGELAFKCPTRIFAGTSSWLYNYAVKDPENEASGQGTYHVAERDAIWGPNNTDGNPIKSLLPGGVNEGVVQLMQGLRFEMTPVTQKIET